MAQLPRRANPPDAAATSGTRHEINLKRGGWAMDRRPLHFTNSKLAQDIARVIAVRITGGPGEGST